MRSQITMALPPPLLWQDFEQLTLSKAKFIFDDFNAQSYGNPGAPQDGVDVYCRNGRAGERIGIQCKRSGRIDALGRPLPGGLKVRELAHEVNQAKRFRGGLSHYIVATTQPRIVALQDEAERLNELNIKASLFTVQIWFWEDYISALHRSADLLQWYYANVLQLKGVYNPDHQILYLLHVAFSRPAFNVRMYAEESGVGLQEALRDTEKALNTGQLQDRISSRMLHVAPGGISLLANPIWREHAKEALKCVQEARAAYKHAVDNGSLVSTAERIIIRDSRVAHHLDTLRRKAIDAINDALREAQLPLVESNL